MSWTSAVSTAKEQSVGGTSISLNVPDIESLPPIDGRPYLICASNAPSSAENGWLHLLGSSFILRKYSWNVNLIFLKSPPAATILAIDSVME